MQFTKSSSWRRPAAAVGAFLATLLVVMSIGGGSASAAIVPTVPLGTSAGYSAQAQPDLDAAYLNADTPGAGEDTGELARTGVPIEALLAAGALMVVVGIAGLWFARSAP